MRLKLSAAGNRIPAPKPIHAARVAHRGASAYAPENTLSAIRTAIELDADLVELDVQRSRDGALVLLHDTTLVRTTNVRQLYPRRAPWRVADFSYDELKRLDAGSWKAPAFGGEQIPTLTDAIELIRGTTAGLLIELKAPALYPGIVADTVATLHEAPGYLDAAVDTGRLAVQSFNVAAMKDHKTRAPAVPVGVLGAPAVENLPALASWADQINPPHAVGRAYLDQIHRLGAQAFVWTVNREPGMRRAVRAGADGIITNRPDVLRDVLRDTRGEGRGLRGHRRLMVR